MDSKEIVIINLTISELKEILQETISTELGRLLNEVIDDKSKDEFLTRDETSKFLNLSLPTITKYVKQGIIPAYRIGNRILFKRNELLDSLKDVQKRNFHY